MFVSRLSALWSLTNSTAPRYESVISCPVPKFCVLCPLPFVQRVHIYNFKFKDGELLLEFYARSDHQTIFAARAAHSFNGNDSKFKLRTVWTALSVIGNGNLVS